MTVSNETTQSEIGGILCIAVFAVAGMVAVAEYRMICLVPERINYSNLYRAKPKKGPALHVELPRTSLE